MKITYTEYFDDFCKFATAQIKSTDLDPVYPVLRQRYLTDGIPLADEVALWRTFLYVLCYNLNTAEELWRKFPSPQSIRLDLPMKTGVERRGFRGERGARLAEEQVAAFLEWYGTFDAMLSEPLKFIQGTFAWRAIRIAFETLPGNGTWASYKWADLLLNVHGFKLQAPDIGVGGKGENAGPVPGMVLLTGLDWQTSAYSRDVQIQLKEDAQAFGVPFKGLDQLETALCDFNSLVKGSYYVGHDIDLMQEGLAPGSGFWFSREKAIPAAYLGELQGWKGVRKDLKTAYRDRRELVNL